MSNTAPFQQPLHAEESIDFAELAFVMRRRWPWLAGAAAGGVVAAALVNLITPSIWQGEFQIVLRQDNNQSAGAAGLLGQAGGLAGLIGLGGAGNSNQQDTELKILQSPSVLQPVYDAMVRRPSERQPSFRQWQQQVGVEAAKGTSVLTVTYRDRKRELVLPTTLRISKAYQAYSGRQRRREIDSALSYLREQINALRPRSEASRQAVERYMALHQLSPADGTPASGSAGGGSVNLLSQQGALISGLTAVAGSSLSSGTSLSQQRSQLQQQLQQQQLQWQRVQAAGDRYVALPTANLTSASPGLMVDTSSALPSIALLADKGLTLADLETQLAERRSRFTSNDPTIARLERQRRAMIGEMNRQNGRTLLAAMQLIRAQLAALERPAGVIERFQQLFQQANREESALVSLENSLAQLELEQARQTLPWELISTPTLLPNPVAPRRGRTLALGLLVGLMVGGGAALVVDRRSGLVFARDELEDAIPAPLLADLDVNSDAGHSLALVARGPLADAARVGLIPLGLSASDPDLVQLAQALQQHLPDVQVLVSANLMESSSCSHQLVVTTQTGVARSELQQLGRQTQLLKQPLTGWLLLSGPNFRA